jgi:outer membrane biosynthesis protein TonB
MTFGPDGHPRNIRVIRGLGPAQDEKALDWAKSLRFVPPAQNGQALPLEVAVEVPVLLK